MAAPSSSWTSAAAATALALAAAVPLVYYKYQHSLKQQERQEALKLLRRVELIVGEVSVRLMHLENQVEDFVANDGVEETEESEKSDAAANSTLGSYYHFDSQGNKLKTKWDSYDVDAELERLEREEQEGSSAGTQTSASSKGPRRSKPSVDKPKLLTMIGSIEHEFEAVLEFLDDIRGDDHVRDARKTLAAKITSDQFARIDALRALLA